jgi:hypothetical protein
MQDNPQDARAEPPFFHDASATVRFWVMVDGQPKAASVSRHALHYRYHPNSQNDDAMETFGQHVAEMEAAVRRCFAQGAREPVMLREEHLRVQDSA